MGWSRAGTVISSQTFPDAPLYTSVCNPQTAPWANVFPKVIPSFLNNFPFAKTRHDLYAPLMPGAFESFDFSEFDLVISVTSEAAKGIITKPGTVHICYCLTPTRYLWSSFDEYLSGVRKILTKPLVHYLKRWDRTAAQRPDVIVGISKTVSDRIKRYYNRDSSVIYPPVNTKRYSTPLHRSVVSESEEPFLVVSRLVPYKKVDLVIRVFNRLKTPLTVVGTGSEESRLKGMAKLNIKFAGFVDDKKLVEYYKNAKALVFPQEEDFGIAAVEAQSFGVPVIAYKKGGAQETINTKTGVLFNKQTENALISAIKEFESKSFNKELCRKNAQKFSEEKFLKSFDKLVSSLTK